MLNVCEVFLQERYCCKQKFLEKHASDEGISLETPIYVVTEGQEPPLFTQFFQWDISKENVRLRIFFY